jgi:His-Xaa-Ser system radical SAM maturase HxsB
MTIRQKNYLINFHRTKRIRDWFLLISDTGDWIALDKKKYKQFISLKLEDAEFIKILEKKGLIITQDNTNLIIDKYKKRYQYLDYKTPLHIISITGRCNQRCLYCHSSAEPENRNDLDLDKKTAKKIIQFIFNYPGDKLRVEFQGGETTLNKNVIEYIVTEMKSINKKYKKDIEFSLVTNLLSYDVEFIEWCICENISLTTSLDGPRELHDKNRPSFKKESSHDLVTQNIQEIKDLYDKRIGCLMVTTKDSLNQWKEIIDEYVSKDLKEILIKPLNKLGTANKTWDKIGYNTESFLEFWKKSMDYIIELNKKGTKIRERYAYLAAVKILTDYDPGYTDFRSPCGAIIGQLNYSYDGSIYTCDEGKAFEIFRIGNVFEDSYQEIINKQTTKKIVEASLLDNYICDNCAYKPYCGICIVKSYGSEGNLIPKIPMNFEHKFHKFVFDYIFEKIIFDPEVKKIFESWLEKK